MHRRDFLQATSAGLATAALPGYFVRAADPKPLRVGLIGTGWYGKCSLFRLIQVLPTVEVVSLCDVDKKMVAEAADLIGRRTKSDKKPRCTAITGRCSRRRTSMSAWSRRPTTGTRCR